MTPESQFFPPKAFAVDSFSLLCDSKRIADFENSED